MTFRLSEEHQNKAIEIISRHRVKKSCNVCYDRGYEGYTPENLVIPCHKCVDNEAIMKEWKEYVSTVPELREFYHELFEEEEKETGEDHKEEEAAKEKAHRAEALGLTGKTKETVKPHQEQRKTAKTIVQRTKNR